MSTKLESAKEDLINTWGVGPCTCAHEETLAALIAAVREDERERVSSELAALRDGLDGYSRAKAELERLYAQEAEWKLMVQKAREARDEADAKVRELSAPAPLLLKDRTTCPHAGPFNYCSSCAVSPCPVGLDRPVPLSEGGRP